MGLTDITKEEERKVEKNEKKMITILGAVIAVIVVILAVMLIMGRDTSTADNSGTSLKARKVMKEKTSVMEMLVRQIRNSQTTTQHRQQQKIIRQQRLLTMMTHNQQVRSWMRMMGIFSRMQIRNISAHPM